VIVGRRNSQIGQRSARIGRCAAVLQRAMRAFVLIALTCCGVLAFAPASRAQSFTITLDPAQTKVEITLDTTLHNVHGTFLLKSGAIRYDAATGKTTGAITVDARSGDTDNKSRDKKMHQEILESAKYPEIIFTPLQVRGSFDPHKASQLDVTGTFRVHGQDHDLTMTVAVQPASAGDLQCDAHFTIPYLKWGMKNPSTFLLHASDTVDLEIHATAHIHPDPLVR